MPMISMEFQKHTSKLEKFLRKIVRADYRRVLEKYGKKGVEELSRYTPADSGLTADSWDYEVVEGDHGNLSVYWTNSNVNNHVNIALILQTGHATGTGGYVVGVDYINPALKPIFDAMAKDAWKEVVGS